MNDWPNEKIIKLINNDKQINETQKTNGRQKWFKTRIDWTSSSDWTSKLIELPNESIARNVHSDWWRQRPTSASNNQTAKDKGGLLKFHLNRPIGVATGKRPSIVIIRSYPNRFLSSDWSLDRRLKFIDWWWIAVDDDENLIPEVSEWVIFEDGKTNMETANSSLELVSSCLK